MASTINASTSAGIIQTADTSGVLALQTGGTTALTINTTGSVAFGTSSTAYGTSGQILTSNGNAVPTWQAPPASMIYPGAGVAVSNGSAWGTSLAAASANTANALVQRDGSGNFSAGTITATLSGNATTATTATTATNQSGGTINATSGTMSGTITSSASSIIIGNNGGLTRGYLYNDSSGFGLLTNTGGWAVRVDYGTYNVSFGGTIKRTAAGQGWLDGGYASIETSATTGAIYSIGGASYFPTASSLNTMYGIGYTYTGANQFSIGTSTGAGNNLWGLYICGAGSVGTFLDTSGNIYGAGSVVMKGNVTAYSDERVKTNWRNLQPDFIEQLAKVKHGIYDRTDKELTQVGVSAQSLQPVLEHAVFENDHGQLSVAYGNAALVACVKLAQRVLELEAKLEQLTKDKS